MFFLSIYVNEQNVHTTLGHFERSTELTRKTSFGLDEFGIQFEYSVYDQRLNEQNAVVKAIKFDANGITFDSKVIKPVELKNIPYDPKIKYAVAIDLASMIINDTIKEGLQHALRHQPDISVIGATPENLRTLFKLLQK